MNARRRAAGLACQAEARGCGERQLRQQLQLQQQQQQQQLTQRARRTAESTEACNDTGRGCGGGISPPHPQFSRPSLCAPPSLRSLCETPSTHSGCQRDPTLTHQRGCPKCGSLDSLRSLGMTEGTALAQDEGRGVHPCSVPALSLLRPCSVPAPSLLRPCSVPAHFHALRLCVRRQAPEVRRDAVSRARARVVPAPCGTAATPRVPSHSRRGRGIVSII